MNHKKRDLVLWVIILFPYLCLFPATFWYFRQLKQIENSSILIINKADFTLSHYNFQGELLQQSKIALGKNPGNKSEKGDSGTPEGIFRIAGFEDASTWSHDFKDDTLGKIEGAYGPYFIRLDVPGQKGIGIHGTHDNNSIGTRASEGCIRMYNQDVTKLVKYMKTASIVVIIPGIEDQKTNHQLLDKLKPEQAKVVNQKIQIKSKTTSKKASYPKTQTKGKPSKKLAKNH
jgi:hypothetical protein